MHRNRLATMLAIAVAGSVHAATYETWRQHREAVLQAPGLARYYTFEQPGAQVADAAGGPALTYGSNGPEELQVIAGRWPQKQAVRLDRGFFSAPPFAPVDQQFTVAAWLRWTGIGSIRGDAVPTGGTLLSVGIGYWDGWRLTCKYPERTLGLELGRPQPVNAIGIGTAPVPDGVWHHVAATWDGHRMALYVDGLVAAAADYAGDYTPPAAGATFRIGFAGYGWGSVKLDVDEVAVYTRALRPAEVLHEAAFEAPLAAAMAAGFEAGETALATQNLPAAAEAFEALLSQADLPDDLAATFHLRLGQVKRAQGDARAAAKEFAAVVDDEAAPEGLRMAALPTLLLLAPQVGDALPRETCEKLLAMPELAPRDRVNLQLGLARGYREAGDVAAARRLYEAVLEMDDLSPTEKLDVRLQVGHGAAEAGDLDAAKSAFAAIADDVAAPPRFRSYAGLLVAKCLVRAGDFDGATKVYQALQTAPEATDQHRWEASERLRELPRIKAGLPARDPAWSRIQLPPRPQPGLELFVAPNGSDGNPGSREKPLATIAAARDAIRALQQKGGLPAGGVAVRLLPGEYPLAETFALTAADTGTAEAPIVYRADRKGTAILTGGVELHGFAPVTDPKVLARLPEESRGKVMQLDLRAAGVTDLGSITRRGMGAASSPAVELFVDGEAMRLARWPNEGWQTTSAAQEATADRKPSFQYDGDRPTRWLDAPDLWLYGYWRWHWADSSVKVAAVDAANRRFTLDQVPGYGLADGMPYYAFNLLEELDQPGEWYLDREAGTAYVWPTTDLAQATVQLSVLSGPLVTMTDVSHVTLEGLVLELGRWDGVHISGGESCLVAACTLRRLGGTGVIVDGGTRHGILGCDIHNLGRGGTSVAGGDRKTLTPGGHFVENCHIHHFSRLDRTYTPAVLMNGVGNRIAHNELDHTPCHAIRLEGNDHVVEYNNVHDVVTESDDQGGLDMWFNPTYRGNVLRFNYWHDIGGGVGHTGAAGIRLDDAISGTLVYGNVFARCSNGAFGGLQIHGGKENQVENNLFIDCHYAISFSGWGEQRWAQFVAGDAVVKATTQDVDIARPPYSTRYPALAHLAERPDVNFMSRNLVVQCGDFMTRDRGIQELMDNQVVAGDPGFVDEAGGDYRLKDDAAVIRGLGFEAVPLEEMGLYQDELRAVGD